MENPIKMDYLGVPLFLETPKCMHQVLGIRILGSSTKQHFNKDPLAFHLGLRKKKTGSHGDYHVTGKPCRVVFLGQFFTNELYCYGALQPLCDLVSPVHCYGLCWLAIPCGHLAQSWNEKLEFLGTMMEGMLNDTFPNLCRKFFLSTEKYAPLVVWCI